MEYQRDFFAEGVKTPMEGKMAKASSGEGSPTSAGKTWTDIDFEKLYGSTTPMVDTQFQNSILPDPKGVGDNMKGKIGKGKKGY